MSLLLTKRDLLPVSLVVPVGKTMTVYDYDFSGSVSCVLKKGATLYYHFLVTDSAKKQMRFFCDGEAASVHISGVVINQKQHKSNIIVEQHHNAHKTTSSFVMRSLLDGNAQLYQKGTIIVPKKVSGANASHMSKAIVLSKKVVVKLLPELAIENQKMQCSHGAAVGHFCEKKLFYLHSRGFSLQQARRLLAESFLFESYAQCDEPKKNIFNEKIKKLVRELV